ncbi:MAG: flagellar biosynthesis protein FlhA [Gammaproteobacteria bacterium]|nr:flagellar biosynthesis protein FlhA [Gammaproteobacteria bacterium]
MNAAVINKPLAAIGHAGLAAPAMVLMVIAMMVLPLPPLMLDAMFTFNISLSMVVILAVIYVMRPLDLGVFPTVLLAATLLRLALNVASTRVVLINGHTGPEAAGKVIQAFGEFVIAGNYAVGIIVFAILVIINFVVITKGAGRVSEVTARFTLDSMPGKQMAIDADLNAGVLSQEEAAERREEVRAEADFYGSMDGASKFVRGDAIAGILILFINLLGGLAIGVAQHDMALADAARTYTLLTIGDGLVAQVPSLLLSTAVAIIVTRMSRRQNMGAEISEQLLGEPRVLAVTGGVLGLLGMIPGMPNVAFLALAGVCGGGAWLIARRKRERAAEKPPEIPAEPVSSELRELTWDDVGEADPIGLEVGYRLISLVDKERGGELTGRIKGVRKKLSEDFGFLVPPVHIRDNLDLAPSVYTISLLGAKVAEAEIQPDRWLAIDPGQAAGKLEGVPVKDPAFGLPALWIEPAKKEYAQTLGFTVVDPATVVATHLSKVLGDYGHELLGHGEAQQLLDRLGRTVPRLVEELVPKIIPMSVLVRVLQDLLREGIPVHNMRRICETLAEHGANTKNPRELVAAVRVALSRSIVQNIAGNVDEVPVMTLDPNLERILQDSLQDDGSGAGGIEPGLAESVHMKLTEAVGRQEIAGEPSVLLVSPALRPWLSRFLRQGIPGLNVLAYNEMPENRKLRMVASVGA